MTASGGPVLRRPADPDRRHGNGCKEAKSRRAASSRGERPRARVRRGTRAVPLDDGLDHALETVRWERSDDEYTVRFVARCACGWETLQHSTEEIAVEKFSIHLDVPWSAWGF